MKYAVSQYGARAHYAVPRILEKRSALERLFTDICSVKGWPTLLRFFPARLRPSAMRRLCSRTPQGIPPNRITAFTSFGWRTNKRWSKATTAEDSTDCYLRMGRELSELVVKHGLGKADGVYAFNGECLELLRYARSLGLRTVLEQTIAPKEIEIDLLGKETELHPGWGERPQENRFLQQFIERQHAEWAEADIIICGSQFVADGIGKCSHSRLRIEVVPYGVDSAYSVPERQSHSGPLRVLTVGTINLRKGSPYVYEAARELKGRATFRMIGSVDASEAIVREISKHVELISRVPRSEITNHYTWADVFLLPSLCEGSAVATYEALAAGLPVVATPNTGTVVRDQIEGFIVPIKNAAAIADALGSLVSNPRLVAEFSRAARKRAEEFTLEAYGDRLTSLLLN